MVEVATSKCWSYILPVTTVTTVTILVTIAISTTYRVTTAPAFCSRSKASGYKLPPATLTAGSASEMKNCAR